MKTHFPFTIDQFFGQRPTKINQCFVDMILFWKSNIRQPGSIRDQYESDDGHTQIDAELQASPW